MVNTSKSTWSHDIGRGKSLMILTARGERNKISGLTYRGQSPNIVSRKKIWRIDFHFPFFHRTEAVIGYWPMPQKAK